MSIEASVIIVIITAMLTSVLWDINTTSNNVLVGHGSAYYDTEGEFHLINFNEEEELIND